MFCRACGHDNGENSRGKCSNCGFDLEFQTLPLREQREGLQKPVEGRLDIGDTTFRTHHYRRTGLTGVVIGIAGLVVTIFIISTFDRAQIVGSDEELQAVADTLAAPSDSLPIEIGADIVYVLNDSGTSAEPRTNLNLSLIPEGSSVAFLGSRSVPIRPLVSFIERKRAEGETARLDLNALCCWNDDSHSTFTRIPLVVTDPTPADSATAPVTLKLIFTEEWLLGRVDEFGIDITAPVRAGEFSAWKLDSVLTQVSSRLSRRDLGGRAVEVTAMFSEGSNLGHAMDIMLQVQPSVDSLGYRGLGLKYFLLED